MNPCHRQSKGSLKFYQYIKNCIIRYSGLEKDTFEKQFFGDIFYTLSHFVPSNQKCCGYEKVKTLGKLQECFLNAYEKIMLILPLDSAKIYPNSIIILVCLSEKESRKSKKMCGHY